jgi:hypothetical protein
MHAGDSGAVDRRDRPTIQPRSSSPISASLVPESRQRGVSLVSFSVGGSAAHGWSRRYCSPRYGGGNAGTRQVALFLPVQSESGV